MNPVDYLQLLKLVAPETIVVLAAFVVLAIDLGALRAAPLGIRRRTAAAVSGLGCLASILWILAFPQKQNLLNGMLVIDPLTLLLKQALLVLTVFTLLISLESDFTEHVGEYFALILLATVGMMFLVSAEELLMIFVSLELISLSLYILTAF